MYKYFAAMKRAIIILTALSVLAAASCTRGRYVTLSGYAQGGEYRVKVRMDGATATRRQIAARIEDILTAVDTTFSGYNANSLLSRINAGEAVEPNKMFLDLLAVSDRYRELSEGAFDVCAGPLFDLWGFGFAGDSPPSPERIEETIAECRKCKSFNFNAIAQGYTCDTIARFLRSAGITDFLVDIGEIFCSGSNPSGKGWNIAIDTPIDGNVTPGASISGIWNSGGGSYGIVTSGNYRKFYIRDGRKYAHTIDPRTGYPVSHNLLSATVVAPTATDADALATWFMVIGFEESRSKVLSDPDLEACLICTDTIWFSPGFNGGGGY